MTKYKALSKQIYTNKEYSIVPIRMHDRYLIMQWRNEQIYHLRQDKPLTKEEQDLYFDNVVAKLFEQDKPNQILFSYLEGEKCIGYGGLVHINWKDNNAEISFVMDSSIERDSFEFHWITFLGMIESVAFEQLEMIKIYTFSFDLRPRLYNALEIANFIFEARLIDHYKANGKLIDAVIYYKKNPTIFELKPATLKDIYILYEWANDSEVRKNAINTNHINLKDHFTWFINKYYSENSIMYIFFNNGKPIGQVRIDKQDENDNWVIDYSIDKKQRGKGYGKLIIKNLLSLHKNKNLTGFVKIENIGSCKVFTDNGFKENGTETYNNIKLIKYIY